MVAAAFALHPLHVESVAWVSERKDVLSTLFWMLTIYAYIYYTEKRGAGRYLLVLLMFGLGLMAKPMLVTLPLVLLLLDYWPLERLGFAGKGNSIGDPNALKQQSATIRSLIWEKAPLFLLTLMGIMLTFLAQHGAGTVQSFNYFTPKVRIFNALVSYVNYIVKMFWPARLAPFYPHPGAGIPLGQVAGALLLLTGITICVIWWGRRWRWLPVGWAWYMGTLVPVIGLIQVGQQGLADRYTYIPIIGLFIIVAWGVAELGARWRYKKIIMATVTVAVLSSMVICTERQVGYWQNSFKLFNHTLAITDDNDIAHDALGMSCLKEKKYAEAVYHLKETIKLKPNYPNIHGKLGLVLLEAGEIENAEQQFRKALSYKSKLVDTHYWHLNLAESLRKLGRSGEAIEHYRHALELRNDDANTHSILGVILLRKNRADEAVKHLTEAVRLSPDHMGYRSNLAKALSRQQKSRRK